MIWTLEECNNYQPVNHYLLNELYQKNKTRLDQPDLRLNLLRKILNIEHENNVVYHSLCQSLNQDKPRILNCLEYSAINSLSKD